MTSTARFALRDRLLAASVAAAGGFAFTYVVKHFLPGLFFLWLLSGGLIGFGVALWKPRHWLLAGFATPSLVILETVAQSPRAGGTALALALGFAFFWALLAVAGAFLGRATAGVRVSRFDRFSEGVQERVLAQAQGRGDGAAGQRQDPEH